MGNIELLTNSIEFIELHLTEDITVKDVANACYCSLSSLQKLFPYAFHYSIKEYIMKRRLNHQQRN